MILPDREFLPAHFCVVRNDRHWTIGVYYYPTDKTWHADLALNDWHLGTTEDIKYYEDLIPCLLNFMDYFWLEILPRWSGRILVEFLRTLEISDKEAVDILQDAWNRYTWANKELEEHLAKKHSVVRNMILARKLI